MSFPEDSLSNECSCQTFATPFQPIWFHSQSLWSRNLHESFQKIDLKILQIFF